jgi:hypothetical protein
VKRGRTSERANPKRAAAGRRELILSRLVRTSRGYKPLKSSALFLVGLRRPRFLERRFNRLRMKWRARAQSKPSVETDNGRQRVTARRDRIREDYGSLEGKSSEGENPKSVTGMKQGWEASGRRNRQEGEKP